MNLRTLGFVTPEAGFLLSNPVHHAVLCCVDQVTGRTGDVTSLVLASRPVFALTTRVTANAGLHLLARGLCRTSLKVNVHLGTGGGATAVFDMVQAGSVTGLTSWRALVGFDTMRRLVDGEHRSCLGLIVTASADPIALDAAVGRAVGLRSVRIRAASQE